MKQFFDFEFTGLHQNTTPISLGIVDEKGNQFYAEFTDYDDSQVDEWLHKNVISNLILQDMETNTIKLDCLSKKLTICGTREFVAKELDFWNQYIYPNYNDIKIEMWSDCLAYDWVLFCELYGGARNIPSNIYYIPFDICTMFKLKGIDPDIKREDFARTYGKYWFTDCTKKHNSLWDAKVIKACYDAMEGNK